jgi:CRP-like cAMP-binding protein
MNFIQFFETEILLKGSTLSMLSKSVRRKSYAKKDLILPVENRSKQIYFVEEGMARVFYANKDKDVTLYFLQENKIGLPIDSIFYDQVCKFGIEALTDTTVATITYEDWKMVAKSHWEMQAFSQMLMVEYIQSANDRIYYLKFRSPKERYDNLLDQLPGVFLQAPLGHIASYLGITQETLSRLRSRK